MAGRASRGARRPRDAWEPVPASEDHGVGSLGRCSSCGLSRPSLGPSPRRPGCEVGPAYRGRVVREVLASPDHSPVARVSRLDVVRVWDEVLRFAHDMPVDPGAASGRARLGELAAPNQTVPEQHPRAQELAVAGTPPGAFHARRATFLQEVPIIAGVPPGRGLEWLVAGATTVCPPL